MPKLIDYLIDDNAKNPYAAKTRKNVEKVNAKWVDGFLVDNKGNVIQRSMPISEAVLNINSFMPVTGDIQAGVMAANDLRKGDYGSAALNSLGLLPFVPALGATVGKGLTKYELAQLKAQENATKMLGLPPDNTAMDRAKALGFDTSTVQYHGGPKFNAFRVPESGDKGLYFTDNKYLAQDVFALQHELAKRNELGGFYDDVPEDMLNSGEWDDKYFKHAEVKDVFLRANNPLTVDSLDAKSIPNLYGKGHDRINVTSTGDFGYKGGQSVVFNPNQVRRTNAAFDPARINEPDLLGAATPEMLALLAAGSAGGIAYAKNKKDKKAK